MASKKYPKIYEQIRQYTALVVDWWCVEQEMREECIRRWTNSTYRSACKMLRTGQYTEEQILELYPLD